MSEIFEQLRDYIGGKADAETCRIIEAALMDSNSEASRLLAEIQGATEHWLGMMEESAAPSQNGYHISSIIERGSAQRVPGPAEVRRHRGTWIPLAAVAAMVVVALIATFVDVRNYRPKSLVWLVIEDEVGKYTARDREVTVEGVSLSPDAGQLLESFLREPSEVRVPRLAEITAKAGTMGSNHDANQDRLTVIRPIATAVRNKDIVFEWRAVRDAEYYTVHLFDTADPDEELKPGSGQVFGTKWTRSSLAPGHIFAWYVSAYATGWPKRMESVADGVRHKFQTLETSAEHRLDEELGRYPNSHLPRALILARFGLLDNAEVEMQQVLDRNQKNPAAMASIQRWLAALRESRRCENLRARNEQRQNNDR